MVRALITIRCSSSGIECDSLAQARRHGAAIVPTGARAPAEHRPPSPQHPDARRGVRVRVAVGAAQRSERSGEPGCGRAPRYTDVTTADAERVSARQAGCDQRAHAGGSGTFALARANEVLSQEVMQPTCPPGAWNDGGSLLASRPGSILASAEDGGDHISGYDTESRGTPAGFETAGRDPSTNLAYEQQIGHQSPANSSVDPRRTTDGGVVGAMGTGETIPGGAAATHAERQSVIAQNAQGTNEPIGVSREQCGDCRREFRQHAQNPDRPGYPSPVVVGDPGHTRVYNSDGSVDVYRPDGSHVGTVPAGQSPAATISNYEGIPW